MAEDDAALIAIETGTPAAVGAAQAAFSVQQLAMASHGNNARTAAAEDIAAATAREDRMYGQEGQPAAAVLDATPLTGESEHGPVFPENVFDQDHVAANRDRAARARFALHRKRYNSLIWRLVGMVGRTGLISREWMEIPEGEVHPRFVIHMQQNVGRWSKRAIFVASAVGWIVWIAMFFLAGGTTVMHDGVVVTNLWNPATTKTYDLTNVDVASWIQAERSDVPRIKPNAKFFPVHVYDSGRQHNVTASWLEMALAAACMEEECACVPAVEIGILADVILIRDVLLFNARITNASPEKTRVLFTDGIKVDLPVAILVEFTRRDGSMQRLSFGKEDAFCIKRAIDLFAQV